MPSMFKLTETNIKRSTDILQDSVARLREVEKILHEGMVDESLLDGDDPHSNIVYAIEALQDIINDLYHAEHFEIWEALKLAEVASLHPSTRLSGSVF
jgi:hypothetical protein